MRPNGGHPREATTGSNAWRQPLETTPEVIMAAQPLLDAQHALPGHGSETENKVPPNRSHPSRFAWQTGFFVHRCPG
jgi:hypothetical protein